MLSALQLQNFRGYIKHRIEFKDTSVIVGMNNAGKSTIVDALRLLSITTQRFRSLSFAEPPEWAGLRPEKWGVYPSLQNIDINFKTIFNGYTDPPGLIIAEFFNGSKVELYIGPGQIFALIYTPTGRLVVSSRLAKDTDIPGIAILPQIGPVRENEEILREETIRRNVFSSRFSAQFRNQIFYNRDCYDSFKRLVEDTWSRIQLTDFIVGGPAGRDLFLDIRNEDFTGELFVMGHGLQMWVQTMWFISRFPDQSTLILDEPDVYMHPDLQRKMCKFLFRGKRSYPQVIVTTHSTEIMSEVDPENILVLDRKQSCSVYADSLNTPQVVLDNIGSVHNIHLARLNSARRFLIVEGEDVKILSSLHRTLFRDSSFSLDAIPQIRTKGWGGWGNAIGAYQGISQNTGGTVKIYVIFDSDYHTKEEIADRYEQAKKQKMNLHIWGQKEIENYLINSTAIYRLIKKRGSQKVKETIKESDVKGAMTKVIASMEHDVLDQLSNESLKRFKGNVATANKDAREKIELAKQTKLGLTSLVSGKQVISAMSEWANQSFGVSFGPNAVAREMYLDEIPTEIRSVISAIENGSDF